MLPVVLGIALAVVACSGKHDDATRSTSGSGSSGSGFASLSGSGFPPLPKPGSGWTGPPNTAVVGLAAAGPGPTLSWTKVPGAVTYLVSAGAGRLPWMWQGPGTSVPFGTVENARDRLVTLNDSPHQIMVAESGKRYRWTVSAFDAKGEVLATSELAEFTYALPPETELPARPPRLLLRPVFDCDELVPQKLRDKFLPAYELEETSPCGNSPSLGCPWNCGFTSTGPGKRLRTSLYITCADRPGDWWPGYPKDAGAKPVADLGKAAVRTEAIAGGRATLLFESKNAGCILKVTSDLSAADHLALAHALEANLTPAIVGLQR